MNDRALPSGGEPTPEVAVPCHHCGAEAYDRIAWSKGHAVHDCGGDMCFPEHPTSPPAESPFGFTPSEDTSPLPRYEGRPTSPPAEPTR